MTKNKCSAHSDRVTVGEFRAAGWVEFTRRKFGGQSDTRVCRRGDTEMAFCKKLSIYKRPGEGEMVGSAS